MNERSEPDLQLLVRDFRRTLGECEEFYRTSAEEYARRNPELVPAPDDFTNRLLDLHRGLVLKVFVEMAQADRRWSAEEMLLAGELFEHLWKQRLDGDQLKEVLGRYIDQAQWRWDVLVGPFERLSTLRLRASELQALVLRLARQVGQADRSGTAAKDRQVHWIERELQRVLVRVPLAKTGDEDEPAARTERGRPRSKGRGKARAQALQEQEDQRLAVDFDIQPAESSEKLALILADLDALIGLGNIKQEVRELVNYLQIQRERHKHGLAQTALSLHSVFSGNPGTGKTTVARLFGRILGAMGILSKGHLIETDRSGIVAEYAGQTAPKTNQRVDEALDGVLFIDEAYSLIAETGDDPYGAEAVQSLLKRMEDDRDRLVVILAGYPEPMERLLQTNPGLSSRFPRTFTFLDYTAPELGRIFGAMCEQNHYELPARTRAKLLLGFQHLLEHRDEHFGNGRLARNLFEMAIRRLANRIAGGRQLTRALLTTLEPDDLLLKGVPAEVWTGLGAESRRFRFICPGCQQPSRLPAGLLGERVQCRRCQHEFPADWGDVVQESA